MSTRVITPEAILSYPHLLEPQEPMDGKGEPKYSASLVFPAGTDLSALKAAVKEVAEEKWGDKLPALLKAGKIRLPFRTDGEEKGYPEGSTFINARTTRRPQIATTIPDADGRPMLLTDESKIYPGAIVRASLTAFTYNVSGNQGVGFGLNNIQFIRDGERLDNFTSAQDEFTADPSAVADLSDLVEEEEEAPKPRKRGRKSSGASLDDLMG